MEKISNSILTVEISEHGAELQSIKKNGKEYLWQGDAKFWGRRSPVLFPNVGRVWNDKYTHMGNTYEIGQHGFARDMDFQVTTPFYFFKYQPITMYFSYTILLFCVSLKF